MGFSIGGLDFSPVKGPEGNIEYLLYLTTGSGTGAGKVDGTQAGRDKVVSEVQNTALSIDIDAIVTASHAALDK